MSEHPWPRLGTGVGLRTEHYEDVLSGRPSVDWFEAITENYLDTGGRPLSILERVRRDHPVALHGVALSIASVDPLDHDYLARLRALVDRIEPALVTDHLCWTSVDGARSYDLLPVPYTEEALAHVVERVRQFKTFWDAGSCSRTRRPTSPFAIRPCGNGNSSAR